MRIIATLLVVLTTSVRANVDSLEPPSLPSHGPRQENCYSSILLENNSLTLEHAYDSDTILVNLTYHGDAWLATGLLVVSSSSSYTTTNSTEYVLALPASGAIYTRKDDHHHDFSKLPWFETTKETIHPLLDIQVMQHSGLTTLSFTKRIIESDNDASMLATTTTTTTTTNSQRYLHGRYVLKPLLDTATMSLQLSYAVGRTNYLEDGQLLHNTLTLHIPSHCRHHSRVLRKAPQPQRQDLWMSHGIMMMFAFAVCVPVAVGASLIRQCLPGTKLWFTLHTLFNTLALVVCVAAMIIAVYQIQVSQDGIHFDYHENNHRTIGLAITVGICLQYLLGSCRPPLTQSVSTDVIVDTPPASTTGLDNQTFSEAKLVVRSNKTSKRRLWEWCHRLLGVILLGLAWYNVTLGRTLYVNRYNTTLFSHDLLIFWCVGGGILGLSFVLFVLSKCI